jgi:hypothetical protein
LGFLVRKKHLATLPESQTPRTQKLTATVFRLCKKAQGLILPLLNLQLQRRCWRRLELFPDYFCFQSALSYTPGDADFYSAGVVIQDR